MPFPFPFPAHRRAARVLPALTLASLAGMASAQVPAPPPSTAQPTQLQYRSAFEGYRAYADQPVESWREANDRVGRFGGWRAYAREEQGAASTPATPAPTDPHAGHHGGSKP